MGARRTGAEKGRVPHICPVLADVGFHHRPHHRNATLCVRARPWSCQKSGASAPSLGSVALACPLRARRATEPPLKTPPHPPQQQRRPGAPTFAAPPLADVRCQLAAAGRGRNRDPRHPRCWRKGVGRKRVAPGAHSRYHPAPSSRLPASSRDIHRSVNPPRKNPK